MLRFALRRSLECVPAWPPMDCLLHRGVPQSITASTAPHTDYEPGSEIVHFCGPHANDIHSGPKHLQCEVVGLCVWSCCVEAPKTDHRSEFGVVGPTCGPTGVRNWRPRRSCTALRTKLPTTRGTSRAGRDRRAKNGQFRRDGQTTRLALMQRAPKKLPGHRCGPVGP